MPAKSTKQIISNERGMTLLEIMVVLAILGGLIGILATNVSDNIKKSNVKQTKIQMNQIITALDMYFTDCGSYPADLGGLVSATSDCSNWGPDPYLKQIPRDKWGVEFVYELDGGNYVLMSYGSDRREGGEGYAKDLDSNDL